MLLTGGWIDFFLPSGGPEYDLHSGQTHVRHVAYNKACQALSPIFTLLLNTHTYVCICMYVYTYTSCAHYLAFLSFCIRSWHVLR